MRNLCGDNLRSPTSRVCASHRCFWARILTEIARICAQKREHSGVTNAGAAILAAGSAIIGPCSPSTRTSHSYRTILDPEGKATVADVALIGSEERVGEQLAELADAGVTDFAAAVYGAPDDRDRTIALLSTARRPD